MRRTTLEKVYNVKIDEIRIAGKSAYVLHDENLQLLFYTIGELQQYLEEVYT